MTIFRLLSKSKKEVPWEVVGSTVVEPVPMHEDEDDLDISHIANEDMIRTYSFDITKSKHFRNAIVFARQMMLQDLARTSYNMLLTEGWEFTLSRRGKEYRAEVRYSGRPAYVVGKDSLQLRRQRSPPFMELLDSNRENF